MGTSRYRSFVAAILVGLGIGGLCPVLWAGPATDPLSTARRQMVENQIRGRGITDPRVLAAMERVARHRFVPGPYRSRAYADHPLPIGEGQTISQPYVVALMTEALALRGHEKVLEIGTGSGYQAAVLAELCRQVYTIEIFESLGRRAETTLKALEYDNIHVKVGDGYKGWPEHAPFDAVIVTCAPSHIPQPLKEQLAEGGRMILPVGPRHAQKLVRLTKQSGVLAEEEVIPVLFVPMIDTEGNPY